jgi:dynamin 1-like protein
LFVPELAFDLLVKPQIKLLEIPSQRCVELVYEELIKICHTCGSQELSRFPRLQGKLIEVVSDLLRERLGPCSNYVESLIAIQRAYINTNHPNFLGAAAAMSSVVQNKQEQEKKAILAEERKKREKRRLKELGETNGVIEEDEDQHAESRSRNLPIRGTAAGSRTMSPHVETGVNGSPPVFGAANTARDSFLNYFFGKDGIPSSGPLPQSTQAGQGRRVGHTTEPSISQSIRRSEARSPVIPQEDPVSDYGRDVAQFVSQYQSF